MTALEPLLVSAVRAVPLVGVTLLGCALFPRSDPRARHAALSVSLAGCLLLPLVSHLLPAVALPVFEARPGEIGGGLTPVRTAIASAALGGHQPVAGSLAVTIWLLGASCLVARLGFGLIGARRAATQGMRAGRTLRVGRGARIRVVFSAAVSAPMAIGLLRPAVLLPADAVDWPRAERRAVLRHEFAHIRRADAWTLLLGRVVRALHWFNPLIWLAARDLRTSSEEACDAAVVDREMRALDYAELLVRLARNAGPVHAAGLMTTLAGPSRLAVRVHRLTGGGWRPVRRGAVLLAGTALFASVLLTGMLRPTFTTRSTIAFAERYDVAPALARQILEAAASERVAPGIAFGLVSVESGFDGSRLSSGGAVGLAQILPETASSLQPGITLDALRRPEVNLRLGFHLLRGYMDGFSGDLERALLAYAVGPANAGADGARIDSSYPERVLRAARSGPRPEL